MLNVVTGTPRSGSTLLCNILAQNKDWDVTDTSPLGSAIANDVSFMSNNPDYKSMLISDRHRTEARHLARLRAGAEAWCDGRMTWEKSRPWALHSLLLRQLFPDSVIVAMVRDPRDICASAEKQHRKFPAHNDAADAYQASIRGRCESLMAPDGIIGGAILAVEDLIRRNPSRCLIIDAKAFTADPAKFMSMIYVELGQPAFNHDFLDVENAAGDVDGLYLHKFPHDGSGKVEQRNDDWRDYIDPALGQEILSVYPYYCEKLGYQ